MFRKGDDRSSAATLVIGPFVNGSFYMTAARPLPRSTALPQASSAHRPFLMSSPT